jgi:hypothetical protein
MPTEPRNSMLTGNVYWSDGSTFTGFVAIGTAPPTSSGNAYTGIYLNNLYPPLKLPTWYRIGILQGAYDTVARIYYNADLNPPNTRYVAYFYDIHKNLVGGPTSLFAVTTDSTTITVPTLTKPSVPTAIPTPQPLTPPASADYLYSVSPVTMIPTGTINGTNPTFALGVAVARCVLYMNGLRLTEGVEYSIDYGTGVITFLAGYIPGAIPGITDYLVADVTLTYAPTTPIAISPSFETPSGSINGVNDTYTLTTTPTKLILWYNGLALKPGVGYSITGSTITMSAGYIPETGDSLYAAIW